MVDKENQRKSNQNASHLLDTYCHFAASKQYLFSCGPVIKCQSSQDKQLQKWRLNSILL